MNALRSLPFLFRTLASQVRTNDQVKVSKLSAIRNVHLSCTTRKDDKDKFTDKHVQRSDNQDGLKQNDDQTRGKSWKEMDKPAPKNDMDTKTVDGENYEVIPEKNKREEKVQKTMSRSNKAPSQTSIKNFQLYDHIPEDVKELFFKQHGDRFRYRHLNEQHKKEMEALYLKENSKTGATQNPNPMDREIEQIYLKEKSGDNQSRGQASSRLDRNVASPVFLSKKNAIFDEKLDSMVKSLIHETKSVLTKMVGMNANPPEITQKINASKCLNPSDARNSPKIENPPVISTTFEEVKDAIKMAATSKGRGQSSNGSKTPLEPTECSQKGGGNGGSQKHPPGGNCDVIVSPYVDSQGNIDYTKAVTKSTCQGDTAAADILAKLIKDPVTQLPTFELSNIPVTSETVTISLTESKSTDDHHFQPVESEPESRKGDYGKKGERGESTRTQEMKNWASDCKQKAAVTQPCRRDDKQDPRKTKSDMPDPTKKDAPCVPSWEQKQPESTENYAEMTNKPPKPDCLRKVENEPRNKANCKPKPSPCKPPGEQKTGSKPPCKPKSTRKPPGEQKTGSKPPCKPKDESKPPCKPKVQNAPPFKPKQGTSPSEGKMGISNENQTEKPREPVSKKKPDCCDGSKSEVKKPQCKPKSGSKATDCLSLRKPNHHSIEGMKMTEIEKAGKREKAEDVAKEKLKDVEERKPSQVKSAPEPDDGKCG